jgi:signal transduction histidine kinase
MKYATVIQDLVGPTKNYTSVTLALFFFSMVKNKFSGLSGYLRLADQYKKLEEKTEELARTNLLKDRLLSIVAHDTRSPIDSMKSLLHLLKNNTLTQPEIDLLLSNLERQADQLTHFLENLLRWTKNNFDQVKVKPEKLALHQLANEIIALLSTLAKK